MSDITTLQHQVYLVREVVRINLAGVSHEESLVQPQPAGNCMNWVLGHLLATYDQALPLLAQQPMRADGTLTRYARGSSPVTDSTHALPLHELLGMWDETCRRVDAGLAAFPAARLTEAAPNSPTGNPNETMGSLLSTILFHQSYHAGQLGVLRRVAGKAGAIA